MSTFVDGAKIWIIYSRIFWQRRRPPEQTNKSARAFETFLHFLAVLCKSSTSTPQNFSKCKIMQYMFGEWSCWNYDTWVVITAVL